MTMLKIAGGIMIAVSCVYLGLRRSMNLKKRCRSLERIQNALSLLETEIAFKGTELKSALLNTGEPLFKEAACRMDGGTVKTAWNGAVKKCAMRLCLTEGDVDALAMLGSRLGMTDTENQVKNIDAVKNMLDIHINAARNDAERFCRLYTGGGVLTGIFIVLMLI
ncbi:MAG TPA: stage III sporulation protein AB [Candidatus Ornithomonoglobus intestinigallinarum]|uniref:Stage III sporulation protein AB n=1 Tax=Candidatus Ornithomonoglobus intestinigallinarum TaxID=2840894 RepID=A0A9D1H241_9FIRM|nr:stage III sporulation protein AB [Candidatus Ornithomonoglobus intestinigallinarum]